ncbi:MAG: ATP/GTP-binding protein [Desulfurococcales archaeon]|nr:ATP/GTP-binding protein [Desulfurococcales archaeon]
MTFFILIAGPAGSGKSTITKALSEWMGNNELDAVKVNFDPAAEVMPYVPDVDVRRYVDYKEIMVKHNLAPNGALTASVDYLINYVAELRDEIDEFGSNYALIDLPGQLEIVAFRRLGPKILKELTRGVRAVMLFVVDARLAADPPSALSSALLALSTLYRVELPLVLAVNKVDLIMKEGSDLEKALSSIYLLKMMSDEYSCVEAGSKTLFMETDISENLCNVLREALGHEIVPVSAKEFVGLDEMYAALQRVLYGGEDFLTEEYSSRI